MYTGYWKTLDAPNREIPETVTITISYHDVLGNKKTNNFPLPFLTYSHAETWGESALDKIAKSLNSLDESIKQYVKHLSRSQ